MLKIKSHCLIQIRRKISESKYTTYLITERVHSDIKGNQKENVQKFQKKKVVNVLENRVNDNQIYSDILQKY